MGLFSQIIGTAVNVAITPVAIIKDAVDLASGELPDATREHIENIEDAIEDIFDDNF